MSGCAGRDFDVPGGFQVAERAKDVAADLFEQAFDGEVPLQVEAGSAFLQGVSGESAAVALGPADALGEVGRKMFEDERVAQLLGEDRA